MKVVIQSVRGHGNDDRKNQGFGNRDANFWQKNEVLEVAIPYFTPLNKVLEVAIQVFTSQLTDLEVSS
jgi:hypothetical protein